MWALDAESKSIGEAGQSHTPSYQNEDTKAGRRYKNHGIRLQSLLVHDNHRDAFTALAYLARADSKSPLATAMELYHAGYRAQPLGADDENRYSVTLDRELAIPSPREADIKRLERAHDECTKEHARLLSLNANAEAELTRVNKALSDIGKRRSREHAECEADLKVKKGLIWFMFVVVTIAGAALAVSPDPAQIPVTPPAPIVIRAQTAEIGGHGPPLQPSTPAPPISISTQIAPWSQASGQKGMEDKHVDDEHGNEPIPRVRDGDRMAPKRPRRRAP